MKIAVSIAVIALVMLCMSFMPACAEENNENVASAAGEVKEEVNETAHSVEGAAANVTEEVKEEAAEAKEEATGAVEKTKETVTSEETKTAEKATEEAKQPGFEAIFAVTGLIGVSYLILRRRQ